VEVRAEVRAEEAGAVERAVQVARAQAGAVQRALAAVCGMPARQGGRRLEVVEVAGMPQVPAALPDLIPVQVGGPLPKNQAGG
jgi:hypothetical protein